MLSRFLEARFLELLNTFLASQGRRPADQILQEFCQRSRLNSTNRRQISEAFFGLLRSYWRIQTRANAQEESVPSQRPGTVATSLSACKEVPARSSGKQKPLQTASTGPFAAYSTAATKQPSEKRSPQQPRESSQPEIPFEHQDTADHLQAKPHSKTPQKPLLPSSQALLAAYQATAPISSTTLPIHAQANLSPELWTLFQASFPPPQDALKEALAFQAPAPLDLRVNTFTGLSKSAVLQGLCAEGLIVEDLPLDGLRLRQRPALKNLRLYREGAFEVQDLGCQIVTRLCGAQPGMHVLDFCAGGGGKTLALLNVLCNRSRRSSITATDIDPRRLGQAQARFNRIRSFPSEQVCLVAFDTLQASKNLFDLVVVDAPCSGLGTLRRNPDKAVFLTAEDIARLSALQTDVLAQAARFVRPGGSLAYITCSVLKAENEAIVQKFLESHEEFEPLNLRPSWQGLFPSRPPQRTSALGLQLSPYATKTDGLFIALLERRG